VGSNLVPQCNALGRLLKVGMHSSSHFNLTYKSFPTSPYLHPHAHPHLPHLHQNSTISHTLPCYSMPRRKGGIDRYSPSTANARGDSEGRGKALQCGACQRTFTKAEHLEVCPKHGASKLSADQPNRDTREVVRYPAVLYMAKH